MKKLIIIFFAAFSLHFAVQTATGEARLIIIPLEETESIVVTYDGQLNFVDRNFRQYEGRQNDDGSFEVIIPLTRPQYFLLGRNYLFLSPSDNLTIHFNPSFPEQTKIDGIGAEVNRYLRNRFFIRGGSFLRAGSLNVMRPTFEGTFVIVDSLVKARQQDLAELDADEKFKEQERIRIKADFVNSLFYFPLYAHNIFGNLSGEERAQKMREYHDQIRGIVQPLLDEMSTDPRFLDIDVVRTVMFHFLFEGYSIASERFHELFAVADRSNRMRGTIPQQQFNEHLAFGETIQCEELREVFLNRLQRHSRFASGAPAIDVNVINLDGLEKLLSDYKGRVMYVDIWATWCGPCRREKPFFRALSKEYENIHFIAISVDDNTRIWNNFMNTQTDHARITNLWARSTLRQDWDIVTIPRFLLIDENFRIISADAPRPSDTERIRALLEYHNNR